MPQYKVTDPTTGRTVTLTGDSPPTEQELEQIFSSLPLQNTPARPSARELADLAAKDRRTWTDTAIDALPTVGGAIGGYVGAIGGLPGSAAGAAAGGAAGSGFQTLAKNITQIPGAIRDIARNVMEGHGQATLEGFQSGAQSGAQNAVTEGAIQGGMDLAGGTLAKGAFKAARGLTKIAFKPSQQALELNPNFTKDILDEGIALSRKGELKAQSLTDEAKTYADSLVKAENSKPTRFINGPQGTFKSNQVGVEPEIIQPVFGSTQSIKNPALPNALGRVGQGFEKTPGVNTAVNMAENILKDNPKEIDLMEALEAMRAEGRAAGQLWQGDAPEVALKKQFHGDLHDAAQAAIERRVGSKWTAAQKETQRRLVTQKTVEDALGSTKVDSHMPTPYDQFLLLRGLTAGNPVDLGIAFAREAGRARPLIAAVGRGVNKVKNVPTHLTRAGYAAVNEGSEEAKSKRTSKSKVDALYERYKKDAR